MMATMYSPNSLFFQANSNDHISIKPKNVHVFSPFGIKRVTICTNNKFQEEDVIIHPTCHYFEKVFQWFRHVYIIIANTLILYTLYIFSLGNDCISEDGQ